MDDGEERGEDAVFSAEDADGRTGLTQAVSELQIADDSEHLVDVAGAQLGKLPDHPMVIDQEYKWGRMSKSEFEESIERAHLSIIHGRKNLFLLPSGNAGKTFIKEQTKLAVAFATNSPMSEIALKALMVIPGLLLQKPSKKSKARDHNAALERRLKLWTNGDIDELLREYSAIQQRLTKGANVKPNPEKIAKVFSKLIFEGKIKAALRYLSTQAVPLFINNEVIQKLKKLHPDGEDIQEGSALFGPAISIHPSAFESIDGEMFFKAALQSRGGAGPSGLDADGLRRIMTSKQFRREGFDFCDALARVAKRLCTQLVSPSSVEALTIGKLLPPDKNPGIRPIGIGESLRRLIGKVNAKYLENQVQTCVGPMQTCAGLKSGCEAAVHAMRNLYENEENEAVLLIDAENAFNRVNRKVLLHNVQILCPELAVFLINTYRNPTRLVVGDQEISAEEGSTQGDPISMFMYAIALSPLTNLTGDNRCFNIKAAFFADDGTGCGKLVDLLNWWQEILDKGPRLGYYPNARKSWLIVKENYMEDARRIFEHSYINISDEGTKHLGSVIGRRAHMEKSFKDKVNKWAGELDVLSEIAKSEPHAAYTALTKGVMSHWTYFMRTTKDISILMAPLEEKLRTKLIPELVGEEISDEMREILELPPKHGGMGIINPVKKADSCFEDSNFITEPLSALICEQSLTIPPETVSSQKIRSREVKSRINRQQKELIADILDRSDDHLRRILEQATQKSASSWLTVLPIEAEGFALHKSDFRDAVRLRYGLTIPNLPRKCVCGSDFNVDHAMICKKGGFVSQRHNEIRDFFCGEFDKVCTDVTREPMLQPLSGESLTLQSANSSDNARLDISARKFWSELPQKAFFDVRVFYPSSPSYKDLSLRQIYSRHEEQKKREYLERILEVEHGTFTPLVFSSTGGSAPECSRAIKRLADKIATKTDADYGKTMQWLRCHICFILLRAALTCLRGTRNWRHWPSEDERPDIASSSIQ